MALSATELLTGNPHQMTQTNALRVLSVLVRRPDGPRYGGAADAARALSVELSYKIEIDFVEMAESDSSEPWCNNTYYYRLGYLGIPSGVRQVLPVLKGRIFNAFMFSTIPELIKEGQYDLVHIYNLHPIWAAVHIAYACKRYGVPYVLACHGLHETAQRAELMGIQGLAAAAVYIGNTLPLRYLVRNSRLIFASTPADFPILKKLGGRDSQFRIVTNGVDPSFFDPIAAHQIEDVRAKYGFSKDIPLLLFVGHLRPKKGVDVLIKALAKVPGSWHLAIVGPHTFPELAEELKHLASQLGMAKQITFTGEVPLCDLPCLHQMADVFVFPSRSETLPLAVLEAMSKKRPIIATNVGGIPFQVGDDAGILVQPDDVDGLAEAISELLGSPEKRLAMGENAYERLVNEFTWQNASRKAIEGYSEIIAS